MARPLRIAFPGAFYHVTARGNERKAVFKSNDRQTFLKYLETAAERYNAAIHAYCKRLISNLKRTDNRGKESIDLKRGLFCQMLRPNPNYFFDPNYFFKEGFLEKDVSASPLLLRESY